MSGQWGRGPGPGHGTLPAPFNSWGAGAGQAGARGEYHNSREQKPSSQQNMMARKEAAQKRRAQEAAAAEQQRRQGEGYNSVHFDAPRKTNDDYGVDDALGSFAVASDIINKGQSRIFGVDYQPATPAPSMQHHLIGEAGEGEQQEKQEPEGRDRGRSASSRPQQSFSHPQGVRPLSSGRPQQGSSSSQQQSSHHGRESKSVPPAPSRSSSAGAARESKPSAPGWGHMAPPQTAAVPGKRDNRGRTASSSSSHHQQQEGVRGHSSSRPKPELPKLAMPEKKLKAAQSFDDDDDMSSIFKEMSMPLHGVTTPLTAIITPASNLEGLGSDMGYQRHKPVYQSMNFGSLDLPSLSANIVAPLSPVGMTPAHIPQNQGPRSPLKTCSPIKPIIDPLPNISPLKASPVKATPSKPVDSNSSSSSAEDSSSDSEADAKSESEEEKEDKNSMFSLGNILQTTKTNSPSSERSVKPTPSPRYPTPSPRYLTHLNSTPSPKPSPGPAPHHASAQSHTTGLALKCERQAASPDHESQVLMAFPPLIPPLASPIAPLSPDHKDLAPVTEGKQASKYPPPELSSDDETEYEPKPPRPKPKKTRGGGPNSDRRKGKTAISSKEFVDSDSDSAPSVPAHSSHSKGRSFSASPMKKPSRSPAAPSAKSTPAHRPPSQPSSAHTTPVHERNSRGQSRSQPSYSAHSTPSSRRPSSPRKSSPSVKRALSPCPQSPPSQRKKSPSVSRRKSPLLKKAATSSPRRHFSPREQSSPRRQSSPLFSVSDSEEDSSMLMKSAKTSNPTSQTTKNSILSRMFRPTGDGGGKGKGKGKKGGITVANREDEEERDYSQEVSKVEVSPVKPERDSWVKDDLELSAEDSSCEQAVPEPVLESVPVRPSLVCAIPLARLGRSLGSLQSRYRAGSSHSQGQARAGGKKSERLSKECWITSDGDTEGERGGPGGGRKRKQSERMGQENKRTEVEVSSHRKAGSERTHESESDRELGETGPGERRKRSRDTSDSSIESSSKRQAREVEPQQHSPYYPGGDPPVAPVLPVAAHPTWPGPGCLMPPPSSLLPHPATTQRVYYSYFERRHTENQEQYFTDGDNMNVVEEAKRLKHEADQESNMDTKCRKYLQAIMMFSIQGSKTEMDGEKTNAYNMYEQTLKLIKYVKKMTESKTAKKDTDIRLVVMNLRAQSLLNLRLYKMKRHELKDCQKTISDGLNSADDSMADQGASQDNVSPTPSPAGSEGSNCSKSSGYASSGETRGGGVLTPPSAPPICLSIPKTVMQTQYNICTYLSQCHELWEQADLYVTRGQCEDFFIRLDQECGPLTLHSSLKDLVKYTRRGLSAMDENGQGDRIKAI